MSAHPVVRPSLLQQAQAWVLPRGADEAPGLRRLAQLLLLASAVMLLAWAGALAWEGRAQGRSAWQLSLALLIAGAVARHGWRLWASLRLPGPRIT